MDLSLSDRFSLVHNDTESARAEFKRLVDSGKEVVLVSACLVGIRCTSNGQGLPDQDAREAAVRAQTAGAEVLPLCPEVLGHMGVPRTRVTLDSDGKRSHDVKGREVTESVDAGARLADLFAQQAGVKRAILCEGSASCGVSKVLGPSDDGGSEVEGVGRLTVRLQKRGLPVLGG